jgi:hypothetical protein
VLKISIANLKLLDAEPDPPIQKKEYRYWTGIAILAFGFFFDANANLFRPFSKIFVIVSVSLCMWAVLLVPRKCNRYFTVLPSKREDTDPEHKITSWNF